MACCPTPCLCRAHLCKGCQLCCTTRCYGGTVDQRAAPKTTMVKCTSDNCERTARKHLTPSCISALCHKALLMVHGSSPCGPLRRCYGGIVDQRAAPKTTMVKCTSDNCECAARKRLTPSCISALCHKALLMEALTSCGPKY